MKPVRLHNHLRNDPRDHQDDADLIHSFLGGNEHSFGLLVVRWNQPVYNFCLRIMGDPDDASDCTQRTFIKVYKKLGSLKSPDAFKSWIYRIATNQCRDEIRRQRRFRFFSSADGSGEWPGNSRPDTQISGYHNGESRADESAAPDTEFEQHQTGLLLHRALMQIPSEQREVVVLKELHQLTFPEIATALETNENTVKSRLYYGLRALNRILTQNPHFRTEFT